MEWPEDRDDDDASDPGNDAHRYTDFCVVIEGEVARAKYEGIWRSSHWSCECHGGCNTKSHQYRFRIASDGVSNGNLVRAAVEFAKEWRRDRVLQKLEALLIMTDGEHLFLVSGNGEVIEPDDGILAIGSGGNYALAAARALVSATDLSARDIAERSLHIAADICVYTNHNVIVEEI